ncbi:TolC family protein [Castellaniella hirudinis]|uniref:TolC family protein n=1 Tax=Castellaniella hirudinis TaxID=1144617 RepID=UPI0039C2F6E8
MSIRPGLSALALAVALAGCAGVSAPSAPDQPWTPSALPLSAPDRPWAVPAIPLPDPAPAPAGLDARKPLDLVALIDIAQRANPLTRQAWTAARQAALGVGLADAAFLPMLSASVLAGSQKTRIPLRDNLLGIDHLDTRSQGTVPLVALTWLLFDFGQRRALREGAEQLSFAANVLFNASHQKVIRDVTDQYYQYTTARQRVEWSARSLALQRQVLAAAQARYRAGTGTTVDVALARQAVAQARLQVVNSRGLEKTTRLALLGALGLAPDTELTIAAPAHRPLPAETPALTRDALRQALSQRPDIVAQYAAAQAEEAQVRAAQAAFMPKIYLGAAYAHQNRHLQAGSLPDVGMQATSSGVMLGVTVPLYDGGLRRNRLESARLSARQARDDLQSLQQAALREMAAADAALQSALQSHAAAHELVQTAQTASQAALAAYKAGMGTITLATEAANQLLLARLARLDARTAAQIAAANLAFATGAMVRPRSQWLAQ